MDAHEEQRLAQQLRAGSSQAWQALYDAFAERIWRAVARRAGPQAADVADIVQETFLAAARSARAYDSDRGSLWLWICGIARNQAALFYRRRQTRPREQLGEAGATIDRHGLQWLAGREDEPAALLATEELGAAVRTALARLPLEYETLLVGKYLDDLTLEQLAAADDSNAAAVSSKLARARRAFRDAFAKMAGDHVEAKPA